MMPHFKIEVFVESDKDEEYLGQYVEGALAVHRSVFRPWPGNLSVHRVTTARV